MIVMDSCPPACYTLTQGRLQVKVTTVVGKPMELPKVAQPSKEQIQKYLDEFIAQMKELFERHKASAGYPDLELLVI